MRPTVRVLVLAIVMVAAACSSEPMTISDAEIATATEKGIQREDYLEGIRAEERLMAECMAQKGYDYTPIPAEDKSVFTADLPGYGMTQSLLDGVRGLGEDPPDPNLVALPKAEREGYTDAATGCRERVSMVRESPLEAPAAVDARRFFDAAWEEFYRTPGYVAAVKDWSACMAEKGYQFSALGESEFFIIDQLVALASSVDDVTLLDEAAVLAIQAEEIAVSDADRACRALHIDRIELDFKTRLLRNNADAVAVLRSATRGETD